MSTISEILQAITSVLPTQRPISLHEPEFSGKEQAYVDECIQTGWVSSVGKFVDRFEQDLAEFTSVKRAIATVNGTAALHMCLELVGVKSNEEVLTPDLCFIATANAISYCKAIPHFVDSNLLTLGVCPQLLKSHLLEIAEVKNSNCWNKKTGRRIAALVVMHTFGHPVDLDPILEICNEFHIPLIEDCAESLGSYYKNKHTGHWGVVSALSFNGNKIVTTGGGGAILTNNELLGKRAKHLTTTAKIPHAWAFQHDEVGYNYRLPNLNAALGCAQLEKLIDFIEEKRNLSLKYEAAFNGVRGVHFFKEPPNTKSNYWLNAIILDQPNEKERNCIIEDLINKKIYVRPVWTLMHKLPFYADCPRADVSQAELIEKSLINLPSSPFLGRQARR